MSILIGRHCCVKTLRFVRRATARSYDIASGSLWSERRRNSPLPAPRMLQEVNELAGSLKSPVESTCRLIQIFVHNRGKQRFETLPILFSANRVLAEIHAHRELVGHFGIVARHVAPDRGR